MCRKQDLECSRHCRAVGVSDRGDFAPPPTDFDKIAYMGTYGAQYVRPLGDGRNMSKFVIKMDLGRYSNIDTIFGRTHSFMFGTNRDMLLFRKSRLWGCYKSRHVTKRDMLLFIDSKILYFEVSVSNMPLHGYQNPSLLGFQILLCLDFKSSFAWISNPSLLGF